ncbi:hypothetical protein ACVWXO_008990 [Bradyrhizobium sp. LM2.7]
MSQTPCKRCDYLLPICWSRAGGDLAQPNGIRQRADRPLDPIQATAEAPPALARSRVRADIQLASG